MGGRRQSRLAGNQEALFEFLIILPFLLHQGEDGRVRLHRIGEAGQFIADVRPGLLVVDLEQLGVETSQTKRTHLDPLVSSLKQRTDSLCGTDQGYVDQCRGRTAGADVGIHSEREPGVIPAQSSCGSRFRFRPAASNRPEFSPGASLVQATR